MKKYVPLIAVLIALTACTDTAQTDNAETTIKAEVTEATEASEDEPVMVSEGYFMPCTNDSYMLITDKPNGAMELYPANDDMGIFEGLSAGDIVKVTHGIILETYPAMTDIYSIEKVSDGSIDNIPADIRTQLEEMGWEAEAQNVQAEVIPQCAPSTGISFELPAGWSYTSAQTEDEPTSSISAYLSPDNETEGTITIEYSKNFAVCGTGLVQKPIDFNGYSASQCYYDGSENWSFIMLDGEYTDCVIINDAPWYDDYANDIEKILSSVKFRHYE